MSMIFWRTCSRVEKNTIWNISNNKKNDFKTMFKRFIIVIFPTLQLVDGTRFIKNIILSKRSEEVCGYMIWFFELISGIWVPPSSPSRIFFLGRVSVLLISIYFFLPFIRIKILLLFPRIARAISVITCHAIRRQRSRVVEGGGVEN